MRKTLFTLLWLSCGLLGAAQAADLGIMPTAVQLDSARDRATVQVVNQGRAPVTLQAEAISWQRSAGEDVHTPTGDLIVNPPIFTLNPGQTQVVRVGLRRSAQAQSEGTYRMVLREVPMPQPADASGVSGAVRVLVALRVPVYVAPTKVQRDPRWAAWHHSDGKLVASVVNAGNVHYKVAAIRLHAGHMGPGAASGAAPQDTRTALSEQVFGAVLFPGEQRHFDLPMQRRAPADSPTAMTLEVLTDQGPHYVPLTVPASVLARQPEATPLYVALR